jgi:putative MATE family efflux protein
MENCLISSPLVLFRRLIAFYSDRDYFTQVLHIALPIAAQQLVTSSLNMASVVIIGQKGDVAVAAVGLANQIFFLLNLVLFGIGSGMAIFTAQLWGKRDILNIRKVLGLSLKLQLAASLLFFALAQLIPVQLISIYSTDARVIAAGAEYLRIFSWSFIFFAVTFTYAFILRSTGNVRMPVVVSIGSLVVNAALTYGFVFGAFGLPLLGIMGAAVAINIARGLEMLALLVMTYRNPHSPAAATLAELRYFDLAFTWKIMKPIIPVALNEIFWSFGITTYSIIYARMGTEAIAAVNIYSTIDNVAFALLIGLGNATAVLVGNKIGAGDEPNAYHYAGRSIGLAIAFGWFIGAIVLMMRVPVLGLYNVSPQVIQNAYKIMTIAALAIWVRATNMIVIIGALRSGGDTIFSLVLDGFVIWLVGVPLAALGAFVFNLPIQWVYLLVLSEEMTKFIFGLWRYFSKKWINNMTSVVEAA